MYQSISTSTDDFSSCGAGDCYPYWWNNATENDITNILPVDDSIWTFYALQGTYSNGNVSYKFPDEDTKTVPVTLVRDDPQISPMTAAEDLFLDRDGTYFGEIQYTNSVRDVVYLNINGISAKTGFFTGNTGSIGGIGELFYNKKIICSNG